MSDYISRKLLEDSLREEKERMLKDTIEVDPFVEGFQSAINIVKCTANADVEPVRRGRWNRPYISWFFPLKIRNPYCFCTYCGHPIKPRKATDYCPNCGAKMDLEDDNEGL